MAKKNPDRKQAVAADRLSLRVDLASGARIGPGKVAVLSEIARTGSISAAGRALKMSYRRTWALVEEMNTSLGAAVVEASSGGQGGGGAKLTAAGHAVIDCYQAIAADCEAASARHFATLNAALNVPLGVGR